MKGDKGISGKTIGKGGVKLGVVVAADRPVLVNAKDGVFMCADGSGGIVIKNSEGTKTMLNSADALAITDTTASTSSTTGSITTAGGLGVALKAHVGTGVYSPIHKDLTGVTGLDVTASAAALKVNSTALVSVLSAAPTVVNFPVDTDASNSTTGPVTMTGGLAVAKKAYIGTTLYAGSAVRAPEIADATGASGLFATATTADIRAQSVTVIKTAVNAVGFYSATTPVAQFSALGATSGYSRVASAATVDNTSTFTGDTGTVAYTISDVVKALKLIGILKS